MTGLAILAVGTVLVLPPATAALAQQGQSNQGGLGGALDTLNRTVNPSQNRDTRSQQQDDRYGRDQQQQQYDRDSQYSRGTSGSSTRSDRAGGSQSYSRYSDQDLRDEYSRITRDQRAVEDEMSRRGIRR
jgi:hypothetical protein